VPDPITPPENEQHLLGAGDIAASLDIMAEQIAAHFGEASELCLVGIRRRGDVLARRLRDRLRAAGGGMSGAFDVTGPLPTGVTVLEASAGTGKTYTIAALAARYVADGIPLEKLGAAHEGGR